MAQLAQIVTNLFQGLTEKDPVNYSICDLLSVVENGITILFQAAVILTVVYIIYGGFLIMFAGGSEDRVKDGRQAILAAIIGLCIALGSWLIIDTVLNVISGGSPFRPWTKLECVSEDRIIPAETTNTTGGTSGPTGACPAPLTALTGEALTFENGQTLSFSSSDPNIQRNLSKLAAEYGKFLNLIDDDGGVGAANSAYRPLEYQRHFFEIKTKFDQLKNNTNPSCSAIKQQILAEIKKHRICDNPDNPQVCVIGNPGTSQYPCGAPHTWGKGLDMTITGSVFANADASESHVSAVNSRLAQAGIDLRWQLLTGDRIHYNLQNAPFVPAGCAQ